jgi:hypothetical protein
MHKSLGFVSLFETIALKLGTFLRSLRNKFVQFTVMLAALILGIGLRVAQKHVDGRKRED